jgi:hypothetical protein
VVGERRNSQILVNLPVTDVPRCTSSNAKTLGLKHLQLPNVPSSGRSPDGERIVHHETDELRVEQNTVRGREVTTPVQVRTQHLQPLGCLTTQSELLCVVCVCCLVTDSACFSLP